MKIGYLRKKNSVLKKAKISAFPQSSLNLFDYNSESFASQTSGNGYNTYPTAYYNIPSAANANAYLPPSQINSHLNGQSSTIIANNPLSNAGYALYSRYLKSIDRLFFLIYLKN